MRISTEVDDPGYTEFSSNFKVYFNGELMSDVVTADEECGYMRSCVGRAGDDLIFRDYFGIVEVKMINNFDSFDWFGD